MNRLFIALTFLVANVNSHAFDIKACNSIASAINKQFSMSVDAITVVQNAVCAPGRPRPKLIYNYTINTSSIGNLNQNDLNTLRPNQINAWCTTPKQRNLLNRVDIEYIYRNHNNIYIGSINFSVNNC